MMRAASPMPPQRVTLADRIASRIVPRLSDLGGPGTVATPLALVSLFSLLALAGIDPLLTASLADDPARLAAVRWGVRFLGVLAPLLAAGKGLVLGGAAWAVLVLIGGAPRFRAVFSAILYGEVVLALQGLWISFVLNLRAGGGALAPDQLRVSSGLDLFGVPSHPVAAALVHGLSVFHVAWVAMLCLAFAEAAGTDRRRASLAALAVWGLAVGVGLLELASS